MQPFREPLVQVCRCCHKPLRNLGWQPGTMMRPELGSYQVDCQNPNCVLWYVTASDISYQQTTDKYLT